MFPSEFVRPVAAPDFLVLPAERVEPRDRQGRVAASAAVAVAMGSAVAAHELDLSTEVRTTLFTPFYSSTSQTGVKEIVMIITYTVNNRLRARTSLAGIIPPHYGISWCLYSMHWNVLALQKWKYLIDNYIFGVALSGTVAELFILWVAGVCVHQVVNEMYGDGLSIELDDLPLQGSQYHMAEFAKKYFREAQRNRRSDTHTCI